MSSQHRKPPARAEAWLGCRLGGAWSHGQTAQLHNGKATTSDGVSAINYPARLEELFPAVDQPLGHCGAVRFGDSAGPLGVCLRNCRATAAMQARASSADARCWMRMTRQSYICRSSLFALVSSVQMYIWAGAAISDIQDGPPPSTGHARRCPTYDNLKLQRQAVQEVKMRP